MFQEHENGTSFTFCNLIYKILKKQCQYSDVQSMQKCFMSKLYLRETTLFLQAHLQPRSQGFSLFVIGKSGKGPGTGRSHDFQHPDIVGVNKLE